MTWFKLGFLSHALSQYGDAITTALPILIGNDRMYEANPLMEGLIHHAGVPGIFGLKILFSLLPLALLKAPERTRERLSKMLLIASAVTWLAVVNNAVLLVISR